jgi:hypothetical protein
MPLYLNQKSRKSRKANAGILGFLLPEQDLYALSGDGF